MCDECEEPFENGDTYYWVGKKQICPNCIMDYLRHYCMKDDYTYLLEGEEVDEDDLNQWLIKHQDTYEDSDPMDEPEAWKERVNRW